MHTPVLLKEVLEALEIRPGGLYVDATAGEGGHTQAILKSGGTVLAIDRDSNQIENLKRLFGKEKNLKLVNGNFADIETIATANGFLPVDGILFDFGLSVRQYSDLGRGLSYSKPKEPLDLRLNETDETKASDILNMMTEDKIYDIFARYSEELKSREIARFIVKKRIFKKFSTVADLTRAIDGVIGRQDKKVYARIFQALRIAVNREAENLAAGLNGSLKILKKEGKVAGISFHSFEDRLVKQFIRENGLKQFHKKVITADKDDFRFARSAKLRVFGFNN